MHGVPGDYTLKALDYLSSSGVRWLGNANELCAGYAADGYARAANLARRSKPPTATIPRVGALFTTYGVGELSAINAVAGAYAEHSPVVHLVGTPARHLWRRAPVIHHTLGDGRLDVYARMAKEITCAQADLRCEQAEEAVERFDHALEQCVLQSRPVYVNLPSDMVSQSVSSAHLARSLNLEDGENNAAEEDRLVAQILDRIRRAERPLIIADGLSYPLDFVDEVNELIRMTNIPAQCFISGKGVVDESLPSWLGPLAGPTDYSRSTDLALMFGPLLSDTNTAAWSAVPDPDMSISFGLDTVTVARDSHSIRSKPLLGKLLEGLRAESKAEKRVVKPSKPPSIRPSAPSPHSQITQDALWARMSGWLRPYDTILLANGTPLIGGRDMPMPSPVQVIGSGIWTSIGSMLPCAQGVAAAKRDHHIPGRTVLFEGDGSFQVTCQTISDILRYKLDVTIFLANNAGYTVCIHQNQGPWPRIRVELKLEVPCMLFRRRLLMRCSMSDG